LLYLLWLASDPFLVRRKGCRRETAPSAWRNYIPEEAVMKCDICGQGFESSEDLQKHLDGAHHTNDKLESPDLIGDTPEESAAVAIPRPTH